MADDRIREEIITKFLLNTCQFRRWANENDVHAMRCCSEIAAILGNKCKKNCSLYTLLTATDRKPQKS